MPDLEKGSTEETPLLHDPLALLAGHDPPIIAYDPEQLTNWRAIIALQGTIFLQPAVVLIIFSQLCMAGVIAGLLVLLTSHPEAYKTDSMDAIVKTVAVSIAFLLGMFLSSCISRWWDTVKSLEQLFGTIKRLTMTAINVELPPEARVVLSRRCVLSTRLLQVELTESHSTLAGKQSREELDRHWNQIFSFWEAHGDASKEEIKIMKQVPQQQRSFFAWSLVSKEILEQRSHLVNKDGNVDALAYDRLCDLVQDGVASVSAVRTAAAFQMPYIYVHLLAFMIHFVNFLTAIGTGVQIGLLIAQAHKGNYHVDMNQMINCVIFLAVQAFIYQAFLTIGAALSFPITGSAYRIPLKAMVEALDHQLKLMNLLADNYTCAEGEEKDISAVVQEIEQGEDLGF
jgi:hypothetical protein